MSRSHKIIGIAVITISILASFFLITNVTKKEFLVSAPRYQLQSKALAENLDLSETVDRYDTAALAKEIASSLVEKNPLGPDETTKTIIAGQPEDLVDNILIGGIEEIAQDILDPKLAEERLLTRQDDSPQAWEEYLRERHQVISNSAISLAGVDMKTLTGEDFAAIAITLEDIVEKLYALAAPPSLASIHHEQIRLLLIEFNVFESLAFYQQDAVRAWLSIPIFEKINEEFAVLSETIADFILTNDLRV